MNLSDNHTLFGRKAAEFVEMAQDPLGQSRDMYHTADIHSACQSLLEGYPVKSYVLFADCETKAQSGRMATVLLNESIWQMKLVKWLVF